MNIKNDIAKNMMKPYWSIYLQFSQFDKFRFFNGIHILTEAVFDIIQIFSLLVEEIISFSMNMNSILSIKISENPIYSLNFYEFVIS
jgi:hypothetical protein